MEMLKIENRIKELRKKQHMSQIRLSIELGVSQETISAYESGKHYPSFLSLVKLSEIFGVSIDYIMGLSEEKVAVKKCTADESILLNLFDLLSETDKKMALAYLQGLNDSSKKKRFEDDI